MVAFGDVRQWRAAALDNAVGELNRRGLELGGMSDELAASGAPWGWTGSAADAAGQERGKLGDRMEHVVAGVAAARRAVADASDSVTVLERLVREADDLAAARGYTITDQGQIVPREGADVGGIFSRARAKAEIADRIDVVLARAEDADEFLSSVLDKVATGQITDGGAVSLEEAGQRGEKQGSFHDMLLQKYNISADPEGMVKFPTGPYGWLGEVFGQDRKTMTAGEAALLNDLGWLGVKDAEDIYEDAKDDAKKIFDGEGVGDDEGDGDGHADAFRHAYWNALLANRFGQEWAEQFTTAHERVDVTSKLVNPAHHTATQEAMDLHNNEVGRRIAAEHPNASQKELKLYIEEAVRNGEMVVVNKDGQLVRSNEVPIGDTGHAVDPPATGGTDPKSGNPDPSGGYNPGDDGDSDGTYKY